MTKERFKDFISRENPELYNEVKEQVKQEYQEIKKHGGIRKGAGRKKQYLNKVKKTFELEKEDITILEKYAQKHHLSKNKALSLAIHNLKQAQ